MEPDEKIYEHDLSDQDFIIKKNPDGTVGMRRKWKDDPMPEGCELAPEGMTWREHGVLYWHEDGTFTFMETTEADKQKELEEYDLIESKIRELAISELKREGKLPESYKQKEK